MTRQTDGKLLVGGKFTLFLGASDSDQVARGHIARVLSNGILDSSFAPATDNVINAIALQTDGSILIGGSFTQVASSGSGTYTSHKFLARLKSDGSLDASFAPAFSHSWSTQGQVYAITVQADGKILVGGFFNSVTGTGASASSDYSNIVRLNADGSIDTTFKITPNDLVSCIAIQNDGQILVGGGFTKVSVTSTSFNGGTTTASAVDYTRKRIARFSSLGVLDFDFDPCADNRVNAILPLPDGKILIGGKFTTIQPNGLELPLGFTNLARLHQNGTADMSLTAFPNAEVLTIIRSSDGKIVMGGQFTAITNINGSTLNAARYIGRINPDGTGDANFIAAAGYYVTSLVGQDDGKIVLGGWFSTVNAGTPSSVPQSAYIARVNPDGSLDTPLVPGTSNLTFSVAAQQTDGKIVLGGSFTSLAGVTQRNIGRVQADGTVDSSFSCNMTGTPYAIAIQSDGQIIAGGSITEVNDITVNNLVRIKTDGTLDKTYLPVVNSSVYAIAKQTDGKMIIGGDFTSVNSTGRNYIARINTDGTLDTTFYPTANSTVNTIKIQSDGKILIGGGFTTLTPNGGSTTYDKAYVARLNSDGSFDPTFTATVSSTVYGIDIQSDGKFVIAGAFTTVLPKPAATSVTRTYLARFNTDSTLDTDLDVALDASVSFLKIQPDGKYLISGSFSTVNNTTRNKAARVNSDGTLDTSFDPNTNSAISTFLLPTDGSILAFGGFTSLRPNWAQASIAVGGIARFTMAGAFDSSFKLSSNLTAVGSALTAVHMMDNSIVVGGNFSDLAGAEGSHLARMDSGGAVDTVFNAEADGRVLSIIEVPQQAKSAIYANRFGWFNSTGSSVVKNNFLFTNVTGSVNVALPLSDSRVLIGGQFSINGTVKISNLAVINKDGTVDTTFTPQPNNTVVTIVKQSDGKFLVGGDFTEIGGDAIPYIARLNADGSVDESFSLGFNGSVSTIALQSDGRILAGGSFTTVLNNTGDSDDIVTRNYMVRINVDLTIDESFDPMPGAQVLTIAVQSDGKITLGGSFTTLQPNSAESATSRNYFARINSDGTLDTTYYPTPTGTVYSQAIQSDGKIIIGGSFQSAVPNSSATVTVQPYLMRINTDGYIDSDFVPALDGAVNSVALQSDGKVIIGGSFLYASDVYRPYIARLDSHGAIDKTFTPDANAKVIAIGLMSDGNVVLGGLFSTQDVGNVMLVGGEFKNIGGFERPNLALLSCVGQLLESFAAIPNGPVYAMARQTDGKVIIGGNFTKVTSTARSYIARVDASSGALDDSFNPSANGAIYAVALQQDGRTLIAGDFTTVGGVTRKGLARLNADGSVDTSFNPGVTGRIIAIACDPSGLIYVGGSYSDIGGSGKRYFARLLSTGAVDTTYNATTDGVINAISCAIGGKIAIGGSFTKVGTASCTNFAILTSTGAVAEDTSIGANQPVYSVSTGFDGKILVAGAFTRFEGNSQYMVARYAYNQPISQSLTTNVSRDTLTWARGTGCAALSGVTFEYSTDSLIWTALGTPTANADSTTWTLSGLSLPLFTHCYFRIRAIYPSTQGGSNGLYEKIYDLYMDASPTLPDASYILGTVGTSFSFGGVSAKGSLRFSASNLPAGISIDPLTGRIYGTPTTTGTTQFTVFYTDGTTSGSYTQTIVISAASTTTDGSSAQRILAYSTRATTSNSCPIIIGFIVKGSSPMPVLLRAIGPGLKQYSVSNTISNPHGSVNSSTGTVIKDWTGVYDPSGTLASETSRVGAAPLQSGTTDTSAIITLQPGAYTFVVNDSNAAVGTVLAEVYDATLASTTSPSRLTACSTRGGIASADDRLIGGYIIDGAPTSRVLLRAIGPSIALSSITDALKDPAIYLHQSDGTTVASNNDWSAQSAITSSWMPATGTDLTAAALKLTGSSMTQGSKDAALLLYIPAGVYTMEVASNDGTKGTVLIDVYIP